MKGWPWNAYVGQKVECINNDITADPNYHLTIGDLDGLTLGEIYTISDISFIYNYLRFSVKEIDRKFKGKVFNEGFYWFRFRPLEDISDLEEILTNINKEIKGFEEPKRKVKKYETVDSGFSDDT